MVCSTTASMVTTSTSSAPVPDGGFDCFGKICEKAAQYCYYEDDPPFNADGGTCLPVPTHCQNRVTCACLEAVCPCVERDAGVFFSVCYG